MGLTNKVKTIQSILNTTIENLVNDVTLFQLELEVMSDVRRLLAIEISKKKLEIIRNRCRSQKSETRRSPSRTKGFNTSRPTVNYQRDQEGSQGNRKSILKMRKNTKKSKKMVKSISTKIELKGIKANLSGVSNRKKSLNVKSLNKRRKNIAGGWFSSRQYKDRVQYNRFSKEGQHTDRARPNQDLQGNGPRKRMSQDESELQKLKESLLSKRNIDDTPQAKKNVVFDSFKRKTPKSITIIDVEQKKNEQRHRNHRRLVNEYGETSLNYILNQKESKKLNESSILRRSFLNSGSQEEFSPPKEQDISFKRESSNRGKRAGQNPLRIKLKVMNQKQAAKRKILPPNPVSSRNQSSNKTAQKSREYDRRTNSKSKATVRDASEEDLKRVGLFTKMLSNQSLDQWSTVG